MKQSERERFLILSDALNRVSIDSAATLDDPTLCRDDALRILGNIARDALLRASVRPTPEPTWHGLVPGETSSL